MTAPEVLVALTPVVETLEGLGVRYLIGGSVASSFHGVARSTLDVDLVADLAEEHVGPLVEALARSCHVDEGTVRDAVQRREAFNVIHLDTMLKVDVFVLKADAYEREAFERCMESTLEDDESGRRFSIGSAEDTVLHKLAWFRSGGEVSDRQWRDVIGVLQVQGEALDEDYLRRWAAHLGVADLLNRALEEAG